MISVFIRVFLMLASILVILMGVISLTMDGSTWLNWLIGAVLVVQGAWAFDEVGGELW